MTVNRGLYIGRFQPYHKGHESVLRQIAEEVDEIVIGIGSAQISHEPENPFTAGERVLMITRSLNGLECPFYVIPIEDVKRNALWVAHVRSIAPPFSEVYSGNPLVIQLFREAGLDVVSPVMCERESLSGTEVRRRMLSGEDWQSSVTPSVVKVIDEINGVERLSRISGSD